MNSDPKGDFLHRRTFEAKKETFSISGERYFFQLNIKVLTIRVLKKRSEIKNSVQCAF